VEGIRRGLLKVLSQHLPRVTDE